MVFVFVTQNFMLFLFGSTQKVLKPLSFLLPACFELTMNVPLWLYYCNLRNRLNSEISRIGHHLLRAQSQLWSSESCYMLKLLKLLWFNRELLFSPDITTSWHNWTSWKYSMCRGIKIWQWLWICLWIFKFENLFIHHLWCNSNTWRECSRLGRNKLNVKDKP